MAKAIETLSIKLDFKDDAGTQQILDKIKSSFKGLGQVVTGNTKPAIQKLRNEINTFASQGNRSISTIDAQVTALRALRREADFNSKEFRELTADISRYEKQLGKVQGSKSRQGGRALAATQAAGAIISGGIFGGPEGAIGGLLGTPFGVPGAFAGAAIGAQVGIIRQSLGGVAETVAEINSMKIALAGVSESAEDYQKSFENVISISKQFLFPVDRAIGEFTKLKAAVVGAGFGTDETTDVFKGFAAAILATGGNAEKLSGALLAASQVFSKGKVQAEELRGQIGERLPGAFTTFAQSIGVSSRDLDEMLRKGQVSTENFVEFTRTLFSRYEKTAETLGSSPEKAGQRLQLALSLAKLEYGGFFQKVGAGFQDYLTNLVNFVVNNKEAFKKVIAQAITFAKDIKDVIEGIVSVAKEAFGGLFVFLGNSLKVFAKEIVLPFVNTLIGLIEGLAKRVRLGQAERKLGGPFGRAAEIRQEELDKYRQEKGIKAPGRLGTSIADNDEIERRAQVRILEEAGFGRGSRKERLDAAFASVDKALAKFDPKSGFGTSLGGKPDLSGGGGAAGDVDKGIAARVRAAQALERSQLARLNLAQAESKISQLLAKQLNERNKLQAKIAQITEKGTNDEIERATASAETTLEKRQEVELQKAVDKLYKDAKKPLEEIVKRVQDKVRLDKQYKDLLAQGVNPEIAKEIINITKAKELALQKLDAEITGLETLKAELVARGVNVAAIEAEIDAIKRKKEAIEGDASDAEGKVRGSQKKKTFGERLDESIKNQEKAIKELIDPLNQVIGLVDAMGESFKASFKGLIDGSMSGKEALANFFSSVGDYFLDMAAQIAAEALKLAALQFVRFIIGGGFAKGGIFGGGSQSDTKTGLFAKGGVFGSNKIVPFEKGGVVDKPTLFKYASGGTGRFGLMGEAGPEAIMPLRRGANGRLGVEASAGVGNIIVNVDASDSAAQGDGRQAQQLGKAIGAAVQAELIKQKRPGGLLS